jgi:hypothetical protein
MSPNSPFSIITEPTAVKRILLAEGLTDLATEIKGDGFAFVPIDSPGQWGLVITYKAPDGEVSHRVVTCDKRVGKHRMASAFATVMEKFSNDIGQPMRVKLQELNLN